MLFYLKPSYGKRSFRMRLSGNFQPFESLDWLCDRSEGIVWHGAIISWLRHGILSLVVQVSNQWVAPRSTLPFTLPRSIKWVPRSLGDLVVKRKQSPVTDCAAFLINSFCSLPVYPIDSWSNLGNGLVMSQRLTWFGSFEITGVCSLSTMKFIGN